jgi:hypothetical protein
MYDIETIVSYFKVTGLYHVLVCIYENIINTARAAKAGTA